MISCAQAEVVQLRSAAQQGEADNARQEWETALQDALKAAEEDRDRAKQQLNRHDLTSQLANTLPPCRAGCHLCYIFFCRR